MKSEIYAANGRTDGNPFTDSVLTMIADIYPLNLVLDIDKFSNEILLDKN